jgi:hypothetical protein
MPRTRTALIAALLTAALPLAAVPVALAAQHGSAAADCTRSQLGVRSNGIEGTAGTIHGAWVFTNLSGTTCRLDGYPDLQLYGRSGRPIRTVVRRNLPPAPSTVTLAAGDSATFFTSYSDVPSSAKGCATSAVMQVTAPNAGASHFIPAALGPCRGVVHVSAVTAGIHHA